jgi:threonine aldolase
LKGISDVCRSLGLHFHMDGARFANACASLGCSPADMTWRAGVDVLCFGGTKNGMAVGEAILFFKRALAEDFEYRCKQAGQLASKMRYLSAPWASMLESGTWLNNGAHANQSAHYFAVLVADIANVQLLYPVQANAVFLNMPQKVIEGLRQRGWMFYTFIGNAARFVFAWDAQRDRVEALAEDIRSLAAG